MSLATAIAREERLRSIAASLLKAGSYESVKVNPHPTARGWIFVVRRDETHSRAAILPEETFLRDNNAEIVAALKSQLTYPYRKKRTA